MRVTRFCTWFIVISFWGCSVDLSPEIKVNKKQPPARFPQVNFPSAISQVLWLCVPIFFISGEPPIHARAMLRATAEGLCGALMCDAISGQALHIDSSESASDGRRQKTAREKAPRRGLLEIATRTAAT